MRSYLVADFVDALDESDSIVGEAVQTPHTFAPPPMFHPASMTENHDDEVQERAGGRLISPNVFSAKCS